MDRGVTKGGLEAHSQAWPTTASLRGGLGRYRGPFVRWYWVESHEHGHRQQKDGHLGEAVPGVPGITCITAVLF